MRHDPIMQFKGKPANKRLVRKNGTGRGIPLRRLAGKNLLWPASSVGTKAIAGRDQELLYRKKETEKPKQTLDKRVLRRKLVTDLNNSFIQSLKHSVMGSSNSTHQKCWLKEESQTDDNPLTQMGLHMNCGQWTAKERAGMNSKGSKNKRNTCRGDKSRLIKQPPHLYC